MLNLEKLAEWYWAKLYILYWPRFKIALILEVYSHSHSDGSFDINWLIKKNVVCFVCINDVLSCLLRYWLTPSMFCLGTLRQIFALTVQSGGSNRTLQNTNAPGVHPPFHSASLRTGTVLSETFVTLCCHWDVPLNNPDVVSRYLCEPPHSLHSAQHWEECGNG